MIQRLIAVSDSMSDIASISTAPPPVETSPKPKKKKLTEEQRIARNAKAKEEYYANLDARRAYEREKQKRIYHQDIETSRKKARIRNKRWRDANPEAQKAREAKRAIKRKEDRKNMTREDHDKENAALRRRRAIAFLLETPEKREQRLAKCREYHRRRKAAMTPEQKAEFLAKCREYNNAHRQKKREQKEREKRLQALKAQLNEQDKQKQAS